MRRVLINSLLLVLACSAPAEEPASQKPESTVPSKAPKVEKPLPELAGFPLRTVSPSARQPFATIAQEELCGCDNPRTLAGCLSKDKPCSQALIFAGLIKGLLEAGVSQTQTQLVFSRLITDGMCADPIPQLDIGGLPFKTNVAPGQPAVEVIEFADFMCSHCAQAVPQFKPVMSSDLPIRMFFVPVQMGGNDMSGKAARAALAAWRQGPDKFWTYHDSVFESQLELNEKKLISLAKKAGLNLDQWNKDRKDPAIKALFKQGQSLSARAGLKGTPYVLINGRPLNNTVTSTDLAARIQLEMVRHRKECEE